MVKPGSRGNEYPALGGSPAHPLFGIDPGSYTLTCGFSVRMNTDQLLSRFRQLYYVLLQGGGWGEVKRLMKRHHLIAFDTREKGTKGGGGESVKEGETRQENRAKPTMGRDLACGHVHERHVS